MKKISQYKNAKFSDKELDDFTKEIVRGKFRMEKKKKWTRLLEEQHGINRKDNKSVNVRRKIRGRYILTIAASLLFLIIAFFVLRNDSQFKAVELAEVYLSENKFPNPTATKGQMETSMLRLKMTEEYNRENFAEAVVLGEQLIKKEGVKAEDYFFLGLSYLYNDEPQDAITSLIKFRMEENTEKKFDQESRWFLALAYIKTKDFEKAKPELQSIVNRKYWNTDHAERLLQELDDDTTSD